MAKYSLQQLEKWWTRDFVQRFLYYLTNNKTRMLAVCNQQPIVANKDLNNDTRQPNWQNMRNSLGRDTSVLDLTRRSLNENYQLREREEQAVRQYPFLNLLQGFDKIIVFSAMVSAEADITMQGENLAWNFIGGDSVQGNKLIKNIVAKIASSLHENQVRDISALQTLLSKLAPKNEKKHLVFSFNTENSKFIDFIDESCKEGIKEESNFDFSTSSITIAGKNITDCDCCLEIQKRLDLPDLTASYFLKKFDEKAMQLASHVVDEPLKQRLEKMGISSATESKKCDVHREGTKLVLAHQFNPLVFKDKFTEQSIIKFDVELTLKHRFLYDRHFLELMPQVGFKGHPDNKKLIQQMLDGEPIDIARSLTPLAPYYLNPLQDLLILYFCQPAIIKAKLEASGEVRVFDFLEQLKDILLELGLSPRLLIRSLQSADFSEILHKNPRLTHFLEENALSLQTLFEKRESILSNLPQNLSSLLTHCVEMKNGIHVLPTLIQLGNNGNKNSKTAGLIIRIYKDILATRLLPTEVTSELNSLNWFSSEDLPSLDNSDSMSQSMRQLLVELVNMRDNTIYCKHDDDNTTILWLVDQLEQFAMDYFHKPGAEELALFKKSSLTLIENTAEKKLSHDGSKFFANFFRKLMQLIRNWTPICVGDANKTPEAVNKIQGIRTCINSMFFHEPEEDTEPSSPVDFIERIVL